MNVKQYIQTFCRLQAAPVQNWVDKKEKNHYNCSCTVFLCESAGIGRQARLRGVCHMAWEFKSPLSHHVVADYVSFATTFSLKSHRLAHAVAPPIPKKSLTFRGPHKFAAQPCGFEPFFFCCLSLAHGLFCRILIPKTCADFPSGGILLQRFRLLHHQ